jgi:hypothetical protein
MNETRLKETGLILNELCEEYGLDSATDTNLFLDLLEMSIAHVRARVAYLERYEDAEGFNFMNGLAFEMELEMEALHSDCCENCCSEKGEPETVVN